MPHAAMASKEASMPLVGFWKVLHQFKLHDSLRNTLRSDSTVKIGLDELQVVTRTDSKPSRIKIMDFQINIKATLSRIIN
jgi:hypothetical protein